MTFGWRVWVLTSIFAGGCISPVMTFGEGKTAKQAQRDTMGDLAPARLAPTTKWPGEVATRKVRVYADRPYRTENLKWQDSFEGPLELANLVLEPTFGVKLVPEYRTWDRHAAGSSLADDLEALAALDPASDVLLVIGLTSALPLVSATFDELGLAHLGGRHLVIRCYADLEERKLYADVFRDLMPEERELALLDRRHHKTAVVLLHEIAHVLGADHDPDDGASTIMNPGYSQRASEFSPRARAAVLAALDARLGRGTAKTATPAPAVKPAAVVVADRVRLDVTQAGEIKQDDKVLTAVELDNLLYDLHEASPNAQIVIRRARKAPAATLEQLTSRITSFGFTRVSIMPY
ncbi:MAG TPA: hypothetical protein VK427_10350 [Kofleriaceae bacterium]|nr:hypothetical protein [Kofleriaceae bacterium]